MARINQQSLESLRAAFAYKDPLQTAIEGGTQGVMGGLDLADTLASRKIQRTKDILAIQKAVEEAKAAAATRQNTAAFARSMNPETPLSSAVPATFSNIRGGDETQAGIQNELETRLAPEEIIKRRSESAKGKADLAKSLQEQKGSQKLEQIRLEALLRPNKDSKATNSFLLKAGAQSGGTDAFIKDIENQVAKMSKATGVSGGIAALKGKIQQNTKGFLGGNANIQAFEEARPSYGRRLYKQLSNDVGNISENEGKFATDLIPSAYETPDRRAAKLARLKELSEASKKAITDIVAKVRSGEIEAKDAADLTKSTVLGLMQEAAAKAAEAPAIPAPGAPAGNPGRTFKVISTRPSK